MLADEQKNPPIPFYELLSIAEERDGLVAAARARRKGFTDSVLAWLVNRERRNKEAEIRFEPQKQKAEADAVKNGTPKLKLEARKIRNQRLQKTKTAAPVAEAALPKAA